MIADANSHDSYQNLVWTDHNLFPDRDRRGLGRNPMDGPHTGLSGRAWHAVVHSGGYPCPIIHGACFSGGMLTMPTRRMCLCAAV